MLIRRTKRKDNFWDMGSRKRNSAVQMEQQRKNVAFAKLNNCPTSPRKMRLVADMVRGQQVNKALCLLKYSSKEASDRLEKLLRSALANWQDKNQDSSMEDADLVVKEIQVNSARMLKRLRPAPQGRGHRIRKRSNHVIVVVGGKDVDNR